MRRRNPVPEFNVNEHKPAVVTLTEADRRSIELRLIELAETVEKTIREAYLERHSPSVEHHISWRTLAQWAKSWGLLDEAGMGLYAAAIGMRAQILQYQYRIVLDDIQNCHDALLPVLAVITQKLPELPGGDQDNVRPIR